MKLLFRLILATALLMPCAAFAQSNLLTLGAGPGGPPAAAGCSQATTFLARTSGLSGTETTAYTNLICGLVTDGTWSLLDIFYIFATKDTTTALLNLISTSYTGTVHNTCTFTADSGFAANSNCYIDTGWKPTNGPNFTQNSASIGAYNLTGTAGNVMGEDAGSNYDILMGRNAGNYLGALCSGSSGPESYAVATNFAGMFVTSRTSVLGTATYRDEVSLGTAVYTSATLSADNLFIMATNTGAPAGTYFNGAMSAAFAGGGLTTGQMASVSNRINAYMTALGINVY